MEKRIAPIWLQWSMFPIGILGSGWLLLWLMEGGMSPTIAILAVSAVAMIYVGSLERVFPHWESWKHAHDDLQTDITHAFLSYGSAIAVNAGFRAAVVALAVWLGTDFGLGIWPSDWPYLVQVALVMLVGELPMYWVHRLEHETDILWRFHALHHTAPRLYWLNALRFHPVDFWLNGISSSIVLIVLGAPADVIAMFGLMNFVHGQLQHSNLQIKCGPLNWIFSMAELHRWHHSPYEAETNTNYGQTLIVWDIVFGTRFLPKDRLPGEAIGVDRLPNFPATYWRQIISPFRWTKTKVESAPK